VPVCFLELGLIRARAVGLVHAPRQEHDINGTGFLVADNLFVTNWHVLPTFDDARAASVRFNFQRTADDTDAKLDEREFVPEEFFHSSEKDDLTIVRVRGEPNATWGHTPIARTDLTQYDRVNIIQHPGGRRKELSFYHNVVTFVGSGRVQYLTDTEPGSSGSPVFDRNWRLVAIHHAGGRLVDGNGLGAYRRNEGIHVNLLVDALQRGSK
jgi:V8-like Glu-specific endopeptidase